MHLAQADSTAMDVKFIRWVKVLPSCHAAGHGSLVETPARRIVVVGYHPTVPEPLRRQARSEGIRMYGLFRLPGLLLLAAIAFASLMPGSEAARAQGSNAVSVAYVGTVSDIGIYLADKKGYFKAEGLDVKLIQIDQTLKQVPMLGTGDLDVGSGTVAVGLYNAASREVALRVVADKGSVRAGFGYEGLFVRKDHVDSGRYKSFADLKGMKIAVGSLGSGNASAANEALKMGGLKFSDATFVPLPFPQHLTAFINKGIDASILNEPTATLAVQKGAAVKIAGNDKIHPNQQTAVILYSEKFAKERPEAARKFMRAYIKAVREYNDALIDAKLVGANADEIIATLTQYTSIKDPALLKQITPAAVNPDGRLNLEGLRIDLDFYKAEGMVQDPKMTVERIVDTSIVESVLTELGPYKPPAR
jgi:NitT/TauT family transport system substrate-binding protein